MTDLAFSAGIRRAPPPPDELGLDPRLLTAEKLLRLAGEHRMRTGTDTRGVIWLDCCECGKGVVQLSDPGGAKAAVTPMGITCAMLRHQVMRHELPLSAAEGD